MEWWFSVCFTLAFLKSKVFILQCLAWSGQTYILKCTGTGNPLRRDDNTKRLPSRPLKSNSLCSVHFVVFNRKCDDVPLTNLT